MKPYFAVILLSKKKHVVYYVLQREERNMYNTRNNIVLYQWCDELRNNLVR